VIAAVRILILVLFIVVSAVVGLLYCVIRPFHRNHVGLFSSWYGSMAKVLGLDVEIRRDQSAYDAMPCVFVANHQNNFDVFTISRALIPGTVTVGKKSLKFIPFFGQLYWLAGNILIDRNNKSKAVGTMQGAVDKIVNDQLSVWVFAEGTRSYGRGLLPFKTGAFHIAQQAGVPIVPICMNTTCGKIKLNRWNNGKLIIEFLPPIEPKELGVPVRQLAEYTHQQMKAKIAELDAELAQDSVTAEQAPA